MLDKPVKIGVGASYEPLPMDKYTVQIVDVNLKRQAKFHSTEEEDVLDYEFAVLDDKKMADGSSTRGRKLWRKCRLAINEKSWLGKLAKAVIGRDLTPSEVDAFDAESIIGKQVDVMVDQSPSKDGTRVFNNIITFSKNGEPMEPIADDKGVEVVAKVTQSVSVAPAKTPVALAPEPESTDVDAEMAALEAEAKLAAAKAKLAREKAAKK